MPSLTYLVAVSLDGFIAGPGGDVDGFPLGDHVDWLVETVPETLPAPYLQALGVEVAASTYDTVVMGSATYALGADAGLTSPYPALDQWVFSARRDPVDEDGLHVTEEDPVAVVDRLVAAGRRIWLCGGGRLASTLADRIDALVLKRAPLVLGGGTPLFHDRAPTGPWRTTAARTFASGVVVEHLERP